MAQSLNSPEFQPSQNQSPEQLPESQEQLVPSDSPESLPEGAERKAEKQPESTTLDQQVVLPQVVSDDDGATGVKPAGSQIADDDIPDVADDVDVIERAWVDKAKQIIKDNRDDPHAQEKEFEKLQIEYHKRRYGRDIKATR